MIFLILLNSISSAETALSFTKIYLT